MTPSFRALAALWDDLLSEHRPTVLAGWVTAHLAESAPDTQEMTLQALSGRGFTSIPGPPVVDAAFLRSWLRSEGSWDDAVLDSCVEATGDVIETAALLLAGQSTDPALNIAEARCLADALRHEPSPHARRTLLSRAARRLDPDSLFFLMRSLTGTLRHPSGLDEALERAVGLLTGAPWEQVRQAHGRCGRWSRLLEAARGGTLDRVESEAFHPGVSPTKRPMPVTAPSLGRAWTAEALFEGIRLHIHLSDQRLLVWSLDDDAPTASPTLLHVLDPLRRLSGSLVFDAICVGTTSDGRRLAPGELRRHLSRSRIERARVEVWIRDLLHDSEASSPWLAATLDERRSRLDRRLVPLQPMQGVDQVPVVDAVDPTTLEQERERVQVRGDRGLLLRRREGRLMDSADIDVWFHRPAGVGRFVIVGAERGPTSARAWDTCTLASPDGQGGFVIVGKVDADQFLSLHPPFAAQLEGVVMDQRGPWCRLRPEWGVEAAFDGLADAAATDRRTRGPALRHLRPLRWLGVVETQALETFSTLVEGLQQTERTQTQRATPPPPTRDTAPPTTAELPLLTWKKPR